MWNTLLMASKMTSHYTLPETTPVSLGNQTPETSSYDSEDGYYGYDYQGFINYSYHDPVDCTHVVHNDTHETLKSSTYSDSAIFGIALTVWTFLINTTIIYACVCVKRTRNDVLYMQITNFCVSNLVVCMFVMPLTIYQILRPWDLGHTMCKFYVIFDIILPFCSFITLIILNIDRILLMKEPGLYSGIFRKSLTLMVIITPWIASVAIVVPLWTSGILPYTSYPCECIVAISKGVAIACPLVTYYLPLTTTIILTIKMFALRLQHGERTRTSVGNKVSFKAVPSNTHSIEDSCDLENTYTSESNDCHTDHKTVTSCSVTAVCLATFFFTTMWFPYQCVSILLPMCDAQSCILSANITQVITWMGAATSGVSPLFWLVDRKIRNNLRKTFKSRSEEWLHDNSVPVGMEETFL